MTAAAPILGTCLPGLAPKFGGGDSHPLLTAGPSGSRTVPALADISAQTGAPAQATTPPTKPSREQTPYGHTALPGFLYGPVSEGTAMRASVDRSLGAVGKATGVPSAPPRSLKKRYKRAFHLYPRPGPAEILPCNTLGIPIIPIVVNGVQRRT